MSSGNGKARCLAWSTCLIASNPREQGNYEIKRRTPAMPSGALFDFEIKRYLQGHQRSIALQAISDHSRIVISNQEALVLRPLLTLRRPFEHQPLQQRSSNECLPKQRLFTFSDIPTSIPAVFCKINRLASGNFENTYYGIVLIFFIIPTQLLTLEIYSMSHTGVLIPHRF